MAYRYTADELIARIRAKGMLPDEDVNVDGFSNAEILACLNEEMLLELVPAVMAKREEYFVVTVRQALTSALRYRIHQRAMGCKLRSLALVDSGGRYAKAERFSLEEKEVFAVPGYVDQHVMIEGNDIVFPSASPGGSLEIGIFFRPGQLALQANVRQVTAVNLTSGLVTVASAHSWLTTTKLDIHSDNSGAEIKTWSITPSAVGASTLTFAAADIDGSVVGRKAVEIGDWVCLENEAALPGLPFELHPILAQAVRCELLETGGHLEALGPAREKLTRMLKGAEEFIDNRVESSPRIVANYRSVYTESGLW